MKPLINRPGNVAALEMLQAAAKTGPAEQIGWRLPQAWSYFLRGKAVFTFSFGDLGALCQDEAVSLVKGNCGVGDAARVGPLLGYASTSQWVETAGAQPGRQHHRRLLARRRAGAARRSRRRPTRSCR